VISWRMYVSMQRNVLYDVLNYSYRLGFRICRESS
jgi:hypothetical protein